MSDPKDKSTIGDEQKSGLQNVIGQQAALMLNIKSILEKTKEASYGIPRNIIGYRNFSCIRDSATYIESNDCFSITRHLTKTPAISSFFHTVPPRLLSILQPSIKIYKVFYPSSAFTNANTQQQKSSRGYDWRIPFDDVSVGSKDSKHSSEYINSTLQDILSGTGRLNGAGIKSFSYSYVGINPAEINTNIVADLELFFQSPEDLIRSIDIFPSDPRFITPAEGVRGLANDLKFSYSDLVNQSSRFMSHKLSQTSDLQPNEHYYRIKVVAGYAMPPDHYFSELGITGEQAESYKSAISSAKVVLFLTPFSHELDVNENGNIILKIKYQAAIDQILNSSYADVLKIGDSYDKFIKLKKQFENKITEKNKKINIIKCKESSDTTAREKQIEEVDSSYKQILDDAMKEMRAASGELYSSIYRKIINLENPSTVTGIFDVQLDPSAVGVSSANDHWYLTEAFNGGGEALNEANFLRLSNLKESTRVGKVTLLQKNAAELKELAQKDLAAKDTGFFQTLKNSFLTLFNANTEQPTNEEIANSAQELVNKENEELNPKNGFVNIKFVFLGDIIDAALDCLKNINPTNDIPRIVLGNINIDVPIQYVGNDKTTETVTVPLRINLADVPISLENVRSFLINKLIRQGRTTYPVLAFIKEIISELVFVAISPTIFGQSARLNSALRISTLYLATPLLKNKTDPLLKISGDYFSNENENKKINPIISEELSKRFIELQNNANDDAEASLSRDIANYYFIYCSTQFRQKNNFGDEQEDADKGIYHFRMGVDGGIVKKITFSKVDVPFMREAVASQEGKDNVSLIKQVYDASIEMFGNNIYRPGDIIYIEPYVTYNLTETVTRNNQSLPFLTDLQEKIGIGGYYSITEVSTTINENIYSTRIKAVFQSHKSYPGVEPEAQDC